MLEKLSQFLRHRRRSEYDASIQVIPVRGKAYKRLYKTALQWVREHERYAKCEGRFSLDQFIRHGVRPNVQDYAILRDGKLLGLATYDFHTPEATEFHLIVPPKPSVRGLWAGLIQIEDALFTYTDRTTFYASLPDTPQFQSVRRFAELWGLRKQPDNQTFIRFSY